MEDLSSFATKAAVLVRDDVGVLQQLDQDQLVRDAVVRYSRVRAREVVADIDGDGGFEYDVPAGWTEYFSVVKKVEYPAGRREPVYLDVADYMVYRDANGEHLRLRYASPDVGEVIRVTFTAQHAVDEASTTVPESDTDIITSMVAGLWCDALASHYSRTSDSTITADSVDHTSRASQYAQRAKRFLTSANELLKVDSASVIPAAGGQASWGEEQDFLTHPHR